MNGYEIPTSIEIADKEYAITNKGDFQMVLDCFAILNDKELHPLYKVYGALQIFYEDINSNSDVTDIFGENVKEAVDKMYFFFDCNQQNIGQRSPYKLIDWEQDSQLICAAINKQAHTEIRSAPYLHYFTFIGYYSSIDDGLLATIINLRYKKLAGKKLEKYEREFMNNNPQYFTWQDGKTDREEANAWLASVWNKK